MKGQLGKQIRHSLNIKRMRDKHNPIIKKLMEQSILYLEESDNPEKANKFIEDRTLDWIRYCAQYHTNPYRPDNDAYLYHLDRIYCK